MIIRVGLCIFLYSMKKRLVFIFWITGLVAAMIIACQFYWVYYNYRQTRSNFVAAANYALRTSVDKYQLMKIKLPTSLQYPRPTLTFMTRTIPNQDPVALDTPRTKRRFNAEFATVAIDTIHLKEIKALVARLTSQQQHQQVNLDTLNRIFEKELAARHITEKFSLSARRGIRPGPEISCLINYYKAPLVIDAIPVHRGWTIVRQNLGPAIVSSILIILSVISLIFMGQIILRQARLDNMKNEFINNISHELRTPLSILRTSNEALLNFGAAEDANTRNRYLGINAGIINEMDTSLERMMGVMLNSDVNRKATFRFVDTEKLVNSIVSRYTLNTSASIATDLENGPAEINTDPYMMTIILNNLVDNAIKYSSPDPRIVIKMTVRRKGWELIVKDNGRGIPAVHLPYIFDKFYRVPSGDLHEVKGYGIGLAYVDELVKKLYGRIDVNSRPGYGTSFHLKFKNHGSH